jgi:very-short-patch-repair endonuclease
MDQASQSNNFHYNRSLNQLAKLNRANMTKSAACMWKYVLGQKQMLGYQFRRERSILNYIADFVCLELLLIIEVDGITHDTDAAQEKDKLRDQELGSIGFTTLRFSSWEVLNRISDVQEMITTWVHENATVPPTGKRSRKRRSSDG